MAFLTFAYIYQIRRYETILISACLSAQNQNQQRTGRRAGVRVRVPMVPLPFSTTFVVAPVHTKILRAHLCSDSANCDDRLELDESENSDFEDAKSEEESDNNLTIVTIVTPKNANSRLRFR